MTSQWSSRVSATSSTEVMLLVFDIGNTNIVVGVFQGERLLHSWRVSTRREQTSHEYAVLCRNLFSLADLEAEGIEAAVISSVVPPLNDAFDTLCREFFHVEPLFVAPELQDLMPILYDHPSDVGADRLINALAVRELFGTPAIIVDFGTATTFDAVSAEGAYLGGNIAPGIGVSTEALFQKAAKLPRIEIRRPARSIGRTTVESMQAGIFYGYVGLVEEILRRMSAELGGEPIVVATGGFAALIGQGLDCFDRIEPDLTLLGLRIYYAQTAS
jgi:type III pantothenate kinase